MRVAVGRTETVGVGVDVAVTVGGTRVSVGGTEVAVAGTGVAVATGRVAVAAGRVGVDVGRAAGAASRTAVAGGRAVAVGGTGGAAAGTAWLGRGVTATVGAGDRFSSYRTPGVLSEREVGAVTTGMGVLVGGGAAAGLAGAGVGDGVGVGVASLATVTRVVLQLETARRTIMAASALFMMPARSIHRAPAGDGGLGDWGMGREIRAITRSPALPGSQSFNDR
ncbi:MAG TPA: hypothetical protein VK416_07685 [Thermoanaerobaculia bacterium]|nr:hypothetical protein [Thermoanaerobaculia bacterium]